MPETIRLSEDVSGIVGFPDAHIEVAVKLPWPIGTRTLRIEAEDLDAAKRVIDAGLAHRAKILGLKQG